MNLYYQKHEETVYADLPDVVHNLAPFLNECGLITKWTVNKKQLPFVIDPHFEEVEFVMYSGINGYPVEFHYSVRTYECLDALQLANIMASIAQNIITEKIAQVLRLELKR